MNVWEQNLTMGFIVLTIGIILFLVPFTGCIESLNLGVSLFFCGMFIAGIGVGILANSYTICKLEKKNQ